MRPRHLSRSGSCADQDASSTSRSSDADVQPLVADDERTRGIEVQIPDGAIHQAASRLPTITVMAVRLDHPSRVVRTIVIRVDTCASRRETVADEPVRLLHEHLCEESSCDPRLVRDDDNDESGAIERADRINGPRKERNLIETIEIADISYQRAVPIKKHCGFHKPLRATWRTAATPMPRMQR